MDEFDASQDYATDAHNTSSSITSLHILQIVLARLGPGSSSHHPDVCGYTIWVIADPILQKTLSGLDTDLRNITERAIKTSFWVPASILQVAVPKVIDKFHAKQRDIPEPPLIPPPVCFLISLY